MQDNYKPDKRLSDIIREAEKEIGTYLNYTNEAISKNLSETREEQIIAALANKGFVFNNKSELYEFAKTKCKVIQHVNSLKRELYVDGQYICEWWDSYNVKVENNKVTVVYGAPNMEDKVLDRLIDSNNKLLELYQAFEDGKIMPLVMVPLKNLIDQNNDVIKKATEQHYEE